MLRFCCPDCKLDLVDLTCPLCGTRFSRVNGVYVLLPRKLAENKISEEKLWSQTEGTPYAEEANFEIMELNVLTCFKENNFSFEGRVLEVGGGIGWLSTLVKKQAPDATVCCTDVSPTALQRASITHSAFGADCFVACDVESLPFPDDYFDFVIGNAVLHHTDINKSGKEIHRVVKKGGLFIDMHEPACNKLLRPIFKIFSCGSKKERKYGIRENIYSYWEWHELVFDLFEGGHDVAVERNTFILSKLRRLYYGLSKVVPDGLFLKLCFTQFHLTAEK